MPRFYLAWVDATETTFGTEHQRGDERIVSFVRTRTEVQVPQLAVKIKNSGTNYLAPGKKVWAWVSWDDGTTVWPLFFGRLFGVPDDLLGEVVTLLFTAEPLDFLSQKQALAQSAKRPEVYDPIFIDAPHREDPDTILEGLSALWHVDPVGGPVTISDILIGEDGLDVFTASDIPYASLQYRLAQPPISAVTIDASVSWTQTAIGEVVLPSRVITTYTGDGLIADWPKPPATLGDAWSVSASAAVDVLGTGDALTVSFTDNYQNKEKEHVNGDTLSISTSTTIPVFHQFISGTITEKSQTGIIDAFSDPQKNVPASYSNTTNAVGLWIVRLDLTLRYDMVRPRTERLRFTLRSDIQAVRTLGAVAVLPEKISVSGADVGFPLVEAFPWVAVAGQAVALGAIAIDTLNAAYHVCIVAGTAGSVEPAFTDIVGDLITDGAVTWAGLGTTLFNTNPAPGWVANDATPLGQIILPKPPAIAVGWATLLPPVPTPLVGGSVSLGLIVRASDNASYQQVTIAGTTGVTEPAFSPIRGTVVTDNGVEWTSLGPSLPGSNELQLATARTGSGLTSPLLMPVFAQGVGAQTVDNEVTWTSLGVSGGYIGAPIVDIARASYFPTDRGQQSIQYLINKGLARLRKSARCVEVTFDCRFERALALSCRKNAVVSDHRLPGGYAIGKIISCTLKANDQPGVFIGTVTIACCIGHDAALSRAAGTPTIFEEDVVEPNVQAYAGATVLLDTENVGYTPPIDVVGEDGLVLPLDYHQIILKDELHGDLGDQAAAIQNGFAFERDAASPFGAFDSLGAARTNIAANIANQRRIIEDNKHNVSAQLKLNPIWLELWVKPINGPFANEYDIAVTDVRLPKQIDLEAA